MFGGKPVSRRRQFLIPLNIVLMTLATIPQTAGAEAGAVLSRQGEDVLIFPITTALQRFLLGGADQTTVGVFVLLDGEALLPKGWIHTKELDHSVLEKRLMPYRNKAGTAFFEIARAYGDTYDNDRQWLGFAFEGFGRRMGFRQTTVRWSSGPANYPGMEGGDFLWRGYADWLAKEIDHRPDSAEVPIAAQQVRLYPVRTPLSRHLTGNADYVVEVLVPIDGEQAYPPIRSAIVSVVSRISASGKSDLLVRVRTKGEAGRRWADWFANVESKGLARAVGFGRVRLLNRPF